MGITRLIGLFAIIPTTVLLTISFFVLYTLRRTDTQGLKAFGYVIAALLWLSALLVFSAGVYTVSTGCHSMKCMMQEMMRTHMQGMMKESPMDPMMHKHTGESMMKR